MSTRPGILRTAAGLALDYAYVLGRRALATVGPRAPLPGAGTPPGSRGRPVVILPGIFESWHYLERIVAALSAAGHPVHIVDDLGLNGRPIPAGARRVLRYLIAHDLRDAVIVAHSKGGLIGKHVMQIDADIVSSPDRPGVQRVAHLIAVNTPWRGSDLARYGVGAWREFEPRRPTMTRLAAEHDVDERITAISSAVDQYVPRDSAPRASTRIDLPHIGHFRVLAAPDVVDLIVRRVAEVTQSSPRSSGVERSSVSSFSHWPSAR